MAIKTVLVEDEGAALRRLRKLATNNVDIEIVGTATTGDEAVKIIQLCSPKLLLLDIQLKDKDAFEVLREIEPFFEGQIIFTTAYQKYAVKAFEVSATDYLLKPFDEDRFERALKKAIEREDKMDVEKLLKVMSKVDTLANDQRILVTEGVKVHHFNSSEIIWVQAEGYHVKVHKLDSTSVLIRKTLKEMQEILLEPTFCRINRSSIINKRYVEKETVNISKHLLYLKGNVKLKKSKKYSD